MTEFQRNNDIEHHCKYLWGCVTRISPKYFSLMLLKYLLTQHGRSRTVFIVTLYPPLDDAPQNVSLELNRGEIPTVNVRWFPPAQLQGPSLGENTTSRLSQNLFEFNFVSIFSRVNNHSNIVQFSLAEILNVIFVIIEYVFSSNQFLRIQRFL